MSIHDTKLTAAHRAFHTKAAGETADDQLEIRALRDALATRDAEIKAFADKAAAEIKDHGVMLADTKASLTALAKAGTDLISLKAVTSVTSATTGTGGVGDAIRPQRLPYIVTPGERAFTIRDLIMPGRTVSNAIEYVKESGFQNMAAPVAELGLKPQSDLSFDLLSTSVKTLAHWTYASKQVLDDIPLLQSYIDGRLRYGLAMVEEAQILGGDGTGQNLLGIIPQATAFAFGTYSLPGDTKIDRVRRAILQVRISLFRATAVVMNPIDWAEMETLKDGDGRYIIGDPRGVIEKRIWGLPVVDSDSIAPGKFLTGAFNMGAQLFDREDANVQVSTEDRDNFVRNAVTIRAEERVALAVTRPESFVYGNLVAGSAS